MSNHVCTEIIGRYWVPSSISLCLIPSRQGLLILYRCLWPYLVGFCCFFASNIDIDDLSFVFLFAQALLHTKSSPSPLRSISNELIVRFLECFSPVFSFKVTEQGGVPDEPGSYPGQQKSVGGVPVLLGSGGILMVVSDTLSWLCSTPEKESWCYNLADEGSGR